MLRRPEFELVGGTETFRTDRARLISATHRDLSKEVAGVNSAKIFLSPERRPDRHCAVRDRPEDIEPLAGHILRRLQRRHGWRQGLGISPPRHYRPCGSGPGRETSADSRTPWRPVLPSPRRGRAILPEHLDVEQAAEPARQLRFR